MRFRDREHAGELLAARLEDVRGERPVVLGLTRGAIPVAFEVARRLGAPLDLVVVRKLRPPSAPELYVGAVAEGGVTYLNPTLLRDARMTQDEAAALAEEAVAELAGRIRLYRGEVPAPSLRGRVVVVVDDFVATGSTARAAARAARRRGAARLVFAVPAIAAAVEAELRDEFDRIVTLLVSPPSQSPSEAYERLEEVSEDAVLAYLRRARLEGAPGEREPAHAG